MPETENKQGSDMPSLVEKLAKDPMRYILFLTSFSVILITLGIIQTLLFETLTFFQDIADSRGWFGLDFEKDGVFSLHKVLQASYCWAVWFLKSLVTAHPSTPKRFRKKSSSLVTSSFA